MDVRCVVRNTSSDLGCESDLRERSKEIDWVYVQVSRDEKGWMIKEKEVRFSITTHPRKPCSLIVDEF